jgi:hydrogenase maturation protease
MCAASTAEATLSGVDAAPATPAIRATPAIPAALVVGLGNPLLGDDGAGWRIVEAVEAEAGRTDVAFDCLAVGGLALMERLVGAPRTILVDAVVSGRDPAGTVRVLDLAAIPGRGSGHLDSAHDVSLPDALEAGRALGADLPGDVIVVTIEAVRVAEFTEEITPAVAAGIPAARDRVLALLGVR